MRYIDVNRCDWLQAETESRCALILSEKQLVLNVQNPIFTPLANKWLAADVNTNTTVWTRIGNVRTSANL